jgi:hypothetical protein
MRRPRALRLNASSRWNLRYRNGARYHPLAPYGLQEARGKALDPRRLRHTGIDPLRPACAEERLEPA